eukprot:TRINITY_DN319_c0_g1_i5.p1 TRINITY_DN319_c0_g1~~TRINITY_DN319_c0_g1_i5.p1  ORF type:complete len:724 (+),score=90.92 TRINITY_DN319_c0_g1_i5:1040-3211(+)
MCARDPSSLFFPTVAFPPLFFGCPAVLFFGFFFFPLPHYNFFSPLLSTSSFESCLSGSSSSSATPISPVASSSSSNSSATSSSSSSSTSHGDAGNAASTNPFLFPPFERPWPSGPPTRDELLRAASKLGTWKSCGPDQVPNAFLRLEGVIDKLVEYCAQAYAGDPPAAWLVSETVPLYKKGDPMLLVNYRQVCLMSCAAKLYNAVLRQRLQDMLDGRLRTNQNGFRKGRGTLEHVLVLRRAMELQRMSGRDNTYMLFVDFSSAFDTLWWDRLEETLLKYGVPSETVTAIMCLYRGARTFVRTPNGPTETFAVHAGVLQGDTLAPYLFVIVMDAVLREVMQGCDGLKVGGWITDLDYADDIVLLSSSADEIRRMLRRLERVAATYGLRINFGPGKTELMHLGEAPTPTIVSVSGETVRVVQGYKYLGSMTGDGTADLARRKQQAWAVIRKLKHVWRSTLSDHLKAHIFNTLVLPVYTYGMETWSIGVELMTDICGGYHVMLRHVKGLRVTRWEERVSTADLTVGFMRIEAWLLDKRLRFAGHCVRTSQPVAAAVLAEPDVRKVGRPPLNYLGVLRKDTGVRSAHALRQKMEDREVWRELVREKVALKKEELANPPPVKRTWLAGERRGRKRAAAPSYEALRMRKRNALKRIEALVCPACWTKCGIHCLVCSNSVIDHQEPEYTNCTRCRRCCSRQCLNITRAAWLTFTQDFVCIDCHSQVRDLD